MQRISERQQRILGFIKKRSGYQRVPTIGQRNWSRSWPAIQLHRTWASLPVGKTRLYQARPLQAQGDRDFRR